MLFHPEIFDTISDDNSPGAEDFELPDDCQYIGGFCEGEIFAVMIYDTFRDGVKLHIQVLPEYREQFAQEFGRLGLDIGKAKRVPIYADIPSNYPNVLKFAQSFGFKVIETMENSSVKNGKSYNCNLLILNCG